MQAAFDIAGDLDTPVSAYMKLASFAPRFLLESVEGGERLGRYSFIGFGEALEVRLDDGGLTVGGERSAPPGDGAALLDVLRASLARAPQPDTGGAGVPLAGGLVGYAAYDMVRYFERLPARDRGARGVPLMHYVAPRSVLVFDHLTRGIALVHAGEEDERRALRREVVRALRGALPSGRAPGATRRPSAACAREDYIDGVRRAQEHIAAGDVYQLVLSSRFERPPRARSLRGLPRAAAHQPVALHDLLRARRPSPWSARRPEALVRLNGRQAQLRPIAGTRPRGADGASDEARAARAARRREGERRARDARRPGAQRSRARGRRRQRARRALPRRRALQPRDAHRERRARRARRRARRVRPVRRRLSRRHAGRRAEGARDADHRGTRAGAPRLLRRHGRLLRPRRRHGPRDHHPHAGVQRATSTVIRPAPVSSPTASRSASTTKCSPRARALGRALELAQEGL